MNLDDTEKVGPPAIPSSRWPHCPGPSRPPSRRRACPRDSSDQSWKPLATSVNWAVTRRWRAGRSCARGATRVATRSENGARLNKSEGHRL